MLDSANYNTGVVTITQNVTILAVPGAVGSLVANNANAIDIATAGVTVTLRNLVLRYLAGSFVDGVSVSASGVQLIVEGSEFAGPFGGVAVVGNGASALIHQSVFRNSVDYAILIKAPTTSASGLIDQCTVVGVVGSGDAGITVSQATVTIRHSTVTNSTYGVDVGTGATVLLEDDQITQNGTGVQIGPGGTVQTTGSNNIKFNTDFNVTGGSLTAVSHD